MYYFFPFISTLNFRILMLYISAERKTVGSIVLNSHWHCASAVALLQKYISRIAKCIRDNKRERKKESKYSANPQTALPFASYPSRRARVFMTGQMHLSYNCEAFVTSGTKSVQNKQHLEANPMISSISHLTKHSHSREACCSR